MELGEQDEFSISGFRIVSYSDTWEHHTIVRKSNIIFELI